MQKIIQSIRVYAILTLLLGVLYPLIVMLAGQTLFSDKANGSLIIHNGKTIGSSLIAQRFNSPKYFHSRFSAVKYNAAESGANAYSPTNSLFYKKVKKHIIKIRERNRRVANHELPADMALNSASGLDPHISLENALLQLPRVAKERGIPTKTIKKLIKNNTENDFVGIWGTKGVNVLKLNLDLDKLIKNS